MIKRVLRWLRQTWCFIRTGHKPEYYRLAMTKPAVVYTRCAHCGAIAWSERGIHLVREK